MFDNFLSAAAPLMLASLGALISELAGYLGIFIEGFMGLGSFFSFVIAGKTGSASVGCLITGICSAGAGWLLARFVRVTRSDPFIAGLALNTLAGAITASCSAAFFGTKGVVRDPSIVMPERVQLPVIDQIPFVGPVFSGHFPFVYAAWFFVIGAGILLGKTTIGTRLRASGLSPEAARERGLNPERYWEGAWACAAGLAALAGAALSFRIGAYTPGGAAGRGWIALSAVYLGFRTVWGTALAALVFACTDIIGISFQRLNNFPATVLLGFPSMVALVLYAISSAIKK
ncbi:ABC transporter permease [Spirochaetia bacterium]|nr:ABC transporter permease [Spirochaetia bacterium]GHU35206.1 ABC transporter permease [Spirochaetia bacterium]